MRIKIQQLSIDIFLNQTLYRLAECLCWFFQTIMTIYTKRNKAQRYLWLKGIIKNYNIITSAKNFYDLSIDSDIKYKTIRKSTTEQNKDCTSGRLLNCDYIKSNYRLIAVDLSWQKELDANRKAIEQTEFVRQLKNTNDLNADSTKFRFVLTILEKIKETRLNSLKEVQKCHKR